MSNDLVPVAYALTETDSYITAMRATRELANLRPMAQDLLLESDQAVRNHWAVLWHTLRGLDDELRTDAIVEDAHVYLREHLDELGEFAERIETKMEEARRAR